MPDSAIPENSEPVTAETAAQPKAKGFFRAFWDFFVLFSGISTRSNLSRTRPDPVQSRGLFLFRKPKRRSRLP
jgi:hypothetical protein